VRAYETSHPWIRFDVRQVRGLGDRTWILLGEARSKCEHLAGTPLKPAVAERLHEVTLIKGAWATTAIEGNTLSEDQVAGIRAGTFKAPPSREYQEREVANVLGALEWLNTSVQHGRAPDLSVKVICDLNLRLLEGVELDDGDVTPGEIRTSSYGVGPYRGAPAEDCEYLLERLCEWIDGPDFRHEDPEIQFALTLVAAAFAHLYVAWIHPFGDGNGRTARLVEFLILARSGQVPLPAAHLMSNHYMLTRDHYYRELDRASRTGGEAQGFVTYAIQGFVDGIRDQIDEVRTQQFMVAWVNYVHEIMGGLPQTKTCERQRTLLLAIGPPVGRDEMLGLSPRIARLYAQVGPRTLSRDLNRLEGLGLIRRRADGLYEPTVEQLAAFLPPAAPDPAVSESS